MKNRELVGEGGRGKEGEGGKERKGGEEEGRRGKQEEGKDEQVQTTDLSTSAVGLEYR